jgi:membrane protease YdiL (CAAX protease family)
MSNKIEKHQSKFIRYIGIISVILACLIPGIFRKVFGTPSSQLEVLTSAIPGEILLVTIVLLIGWKLGFKNISINKPRWKKIYWLIPEFFLIVAVFSMIEKPTIQPSYFMIGKLLFLAVLVGIYEELLSRGIILHLFSKFSNVKSAILFSGIIFGLFHFSSYHGSNGVDTFQQIVETAAAGIYAGVIVFTLRSLIPLIVTHLFFDFFQFVSMYFNELNSGTVAETVRVAPALFDISNYILAILYLLVALVIYLFERNNINEYHKQLQGKSSDIALSNSDLYVNVGFMIISILVINIIL